MGGEPAVRWMDENQHTFSLIIGLMSGTITVVAAGGDALSLVAALAMTLDLTAT